MSSLFESSTDEANEFQSSIVFKEAFEMMLVFGKYSLNGFASVEVSKHFLQC